MLNEMKSAFGGNIKKLAIGLSASAIMLATMAVSVGAIAPNWDVTGSYDIAFACTPSCGGPFTHDATLTQAGSSVTGDGGFPAGGTHTFHWNITSGSVAGDTINLTMVYDLGASGTTMNMTGTIAPDGTMSGTWNDDFGGPRTGTWVTTAGNATSLVPTECQNMTFDNVILGTAGADVLTGTPDRDLILAKGGSDQVTGNNGDDCIVGGDGSDKLIGNNGNDVVLGGNGSDSLEGNNGEDKLYGQGESDSLIGGNQNDQLFGGAASDSLRGGAGDDVLNGDEGSDSLRGGSGDDNLTGGAGVDSARGEANTDTCDAESENTCEI